MISVYDLGPSKIPESLGASPNDRKVIFTLNYKKLPYKIIIITMDDIESTAKSIGAPPTSKKSDGTPRYTVPFIHDSGTGKCISDSFRIAQYLDEAYPETPKVLPAGTEILQAAFIQIVEEKLTPIAEVYLPKVMELSSSEALESRARKYGPIPPPLPAEEQGKTWEKLRVGYDGLKEAYEMGGYHNRDGEERIFLMGDEPVFADLAFAAWIAMVKITWGDESEEWKHASGWIDGRAGRLVDRVLRYERASVGI
ncbi:hypothetical protein AAF712_011167 [Marasmius tenuissimus]|uniref:GST N-terminal domain-containing protein n=1 Tax=Marasmius tenuissimus TaxID=585030 RepID=A0ABR2ZK70_9AGAR